MEKTYLNTVGIFECIVQAPGLDGDGKSFGFISQSKKKGTPCVHLRLTVTEGDHNGEITATDLWLSENSEDNTTARLAEVFGFDGDYRKLHEAKPGFTGMKCQIETENELGSDGKNRVKVKWVNPSGGGKSKSKAMEASKVESIFAKINIAKHKAIAKTATAALKASGAAPVVAAAAPAGDGPPESDDVPF